MGQIIVGMDESEGAATALRWAVREGQLRGWTVTAVLVWSYLDQHHAGEVDGFDPRYDEDAARRALDAAVVRAVEAPTAAAVARRTVCDRPAPGLIDQAGTADLLVVGARGMGGFRSLLLGSVSYHVVHHSPCPVVVVRGTDGTVTHAPERIVVGVDGSLTARDALRWALEAARVRGATVEVVHAWQLPLVGGPFSAVGFDPTVMEDAARELLDTVVDGEDTAGVTVERTLVSGTPATAILDAAETADLVVVGYRGMSELKRLLLGSVSHQVTLHSHGPVVVIPAAERHEG